MAVDTLFSHLGDTDTDYDEGTKGTPDVRVDKPEPMTDEDYYAVINAAIDAAEDYVDTELSPDREQASRYYRGEPFGDEEEGKSDVVMTEVRDSVLACMPDLLRVFCGSTDPVEFNSNGGSDPEVASQQTEYISHIVMADNPGFMIMHNVMKDALVRRLGVLTWWHEKKEIVTEAEFSDLPPDSLILLQSEMTDASDNSENIQYDVKVTKETDGEDAEGQPIKFSSGIVKRRMIRKRFRVRALPPEEFLITPATSDDLDEFQIIGVRTISTVSKLIQDGYDQEEIDEILGTTAPLSATRLDTNTERLDRSPAFMGQVFNAGFEGVDPSSRAVKVCTVYCLIDRDGDGIAERRKIVTIGDRNRPLYDEVFGEDKIVPFATFCPDPEPHTPVGYSLADQTMDLQEIKSQIVRRTLDSLDQSVSNRLVAVEGQTNLDDAMNTENGAIIRVKSIGAVQQLQTVFQGQAALGVLSYFDEVRARRTGQMAGPTGLDPDVLQSTTKSAADAVVDGSHARTEMIARIFAETGFKRLFRGILELVCAHQDYKRVLRLRGTIKTIDPRSWDAATDLSVNVGMGRGKKAERIMSLTTILAQQKEIITQYGPSNPLVSINHISYTMTQIVKEMGFSDPSRFFNTIDVEQAKQIAQALASQPKKPTPEELLAAAQDKKTNQEAMAADAKNQTERFKAVLADDRERDKAEMDYAVAAATAVAEYGAQVDEQHMRQEEAEHAATDDMVKTALAGAGGAPAPGGPPAAPAPGGPPQ